ncbi:MAG: hypothetical protein WEB58_13655 [Planctomycetaceae bacterium]
MPYVNPQIPPDPNLPRTPEQLRGEHFNPDGPWEWQNCKPAKDEPGTFGQMWYYINHGNSPQPLSESHTEQLAATLLADPETWGTVILHCIGTARKAGAA